MASPLVRKRSLYQHGSTAESDSARSAPSAAKRPRILALACGSPLSPGSAPTSADLANNKPRSAVMYAVVDSPPPSGPKYCYLGPQLSLGSGAVVNFPVSTDTNCGTPIKSDTFSRTTTAEAKFLDCYEILHEAAEDQQQQRNSDSGHKTFVVVQLLGTGEGSGKIGLCRRISYEKYSRYVELYRRFTEQPATDEDELDVEVDYDHDSVFRRLWPDGCRLFTITDPATKRPYHYIYTPRHHGSLHVHVVDQKKLNVVEALKFFRQIVEAVAFCHARGVVLRDVKLRKFVFADRLRVNVRFCDLDEFYPLPDPRNDSMRERNGCPAYVSPEIIDFRSQTYAGRPADVWGLGVLLYVMLIGRYPFYDTTPLGLFLKIRAAKLPLSERATGTVPAVLRYAMRCVLSKEARDRPTAADILRMPWCCRDDDASCYVNDEKNASSKDGAAIVCSIDILEAASAAGDWSSEDGASVANAQSIEVLDVATGSTTRLSDLAEDGAASVRRSIDISLGMSDY